MAKRLRSSSSLSGPSSIGDRCEAIGAVTALQTLPTSALEDVLKRLLAAVRSNAEADTISLVHKILSVAASSQEMTTAETRLLTIHSASVPPSSYHRLPPVVINLFFF